MNVLPKTLCIVALFTVIGCSSDDDSDDPTSADAGNSSTNDMKSSDDEPDVGPGRPTESCNRPCGARQKCYFDDACLDIPPVGECYDDTDCPVSDECMGATYCPPDVVCIVATMPGECSTTQ